MFKPTDYKLMNVADGRLFEDASGWALSAPAPEACSPAATASAACAPSKPSLVRAVYSSRLFSPREDLDGLYRYADWMPIRRTLEGSHRPVTYKSKGLAGYLGLENLYITFSGYYPAIGAGMETCSFKETEAYSVCARLPEGCEKVLVVASAGNTARAFAKVCSDNRIPLLLSIPLDNIGALWFREPLNDCVKIVASPSGSDYYDAIHLADIACKSPRFMAEGGAKNVARRDGMGTTLLSAVEAIGRIPDAYFQAVGSGTGAIAAWENCLRLLADGRFGTAKMRLYPSQNIPFTIMYDSWKARSRELVPLDADEARDQAATIVAKVLSNRKPPYPVAGGLFDALCDSGGDMLAVTNDELALWAARFEQLEGVDIHPAAAVATASLAAAVASGAVRPDETIMLNITGGGEALLRHTFPTLSASSALSSVQTSCTPASSAAFLSPDQAASTTSSISPDQAASTIQSPIPSGTLLPTEIGVPILVLDPSLPESSLITQIESLWK